MKIFLAALFSIVSFSVFAQPAVIIPGWGHFPVEQSTTFSVPQPTREESNLSVRNGIFTKEYQWLTGNYNTDQFIMGDSQKKCNEWPVEITSSLEVLNLKDFKVESRFGTKTLVTHYSTPSVNTRPICLLDIQLTGSSFFSTVSKRFTGRGRNENCESERKEILKNMIVIDDFGCKEFGRFRKHTELSLFGINTSAQE